MVKHCKIMKDINRGPYSKKSPNTSKLFKTPSLDESSSPEFDLFSDLEEHSEEEVAGTMTETMEEYMCKTQGDYGSGVTRPKIDAKYHFELKGQFLKELRNNTFSGSDHEDANEHIESMGKIQRTIDEIPSTLLDEYARAQLKNLGREIKTVNEKVYAAQKGSYGLQYLDACSNRATRLYDYLPQKKKYPGSFTLPCYINNIYFEKALADLGASVSVMPLTTYLNLGLGELAHTKLTIELADRTMKHPKGITENVLVGIELRRNQVGDLEPTIKEDEVVDKPMFDGVKTRNDGNMVSRIIGYPSFFLILSINVMCKKFYNSIMKDKVEYNGRNVLGTFVNSPIFVGNFFVATNFTVVKNMDAYRDEGMGEVIVGEPFCKASYVVARRFYGMITIFNGNYSVTYQMKGFYKGVLNLGPEFIRDAKVEEWLTRGHISMHEME
ncbi:homeodomain-like protein [Tanacetum coccineum]